MDRLLSMRVFERVVHEGGFAAANDKVALTHRDRADLPQPGAQRPGGH